MVYGGSPSAVRIIQFFERMDMILRKIDIATAGAYLGYQDQIRKWISELVVLMRIVITVAKDKDKLDYFKRWNNELNDIVKKMSSNENSLVVCNDLNILSHKVLEFANINGLLMPSPSKVSGLMKGLSEYGLSSEDISKISHSKGGYKSYN